jgi:diacylglycerol kinase family enzyme
MARRILILRNAAAGRGGATLSEAVARAARALGLSVESAAPTSAAALADSVATADVDAIALAGGDGTVRIAAPALAARGIPFALLPTGTANVLALEARAPQSAEAIAALLAQGEPRPLPWGRANGAPFVLVAGAGLDGMAALHARAWKTTLGRAAYWAGIARASLGAHRLSVSIDWRPSLAADWVMCTAARRTPRRVGARLLLAIFTGGPALRPLQLAAVAASRLAAAPGVQLTPFRTASIIADPEAPTQVDGEPLGVTPLTLTAEPAPLLMLRSGTSATVR